MNRIPNLYKKAHVFRCVHDAHRNFKAEMSPFYILQEKKCYPDGCVYFNWKCRLLAKQKTCFRGFSHVGKECSNCKYFYEEKRHQFPEFIENGETAADFMNDYIAFEEGVAELKIKRVICEGSVAGVTPGLTLQQQGNHYHLMSHGFLVRFDEGYIDNCLFIDPFYLSLSSMTQNKLLLRGGDNLEFLAQLIIDRGRFKFIKAGRFQFFERGSGKPMRNSDVQVGLKTYTIQENQPSKCMGCADGVLVDINRLKRGPSRATVCLQGIVDYRYCISATTLPKAGPIETCVNTQWGKHNCHLVL